jgi:hypothetical protein
MMIATRRPLEICDRVMPMQHVREPCRGDLGRRAPGDRPPRIPRRPHRVKSPPLSAIFAKKLAEGSVQCVPFRGIKSVFL